ncbi:hypothetical protein PIROE2DRAFT_61564 [Piromyces sp. E2]|nr:hypothetical protein PIROE2DRAFT_61564 [Piromyces sp. E2]|eukprot:OUM62937.1 hypothetical protein PIROE2DRAFT_61564 [Piromyces sp. E2]
MNSAMLEDNSVTNIFSLKGVSKIKWKRYYYIYKKDIEKNISNSFQPLESGLLKDPIISTYLKLIANDVLCIWINAQYNNEDEFEGKPTKFFSKSGNFKLNDLMDISKTTEQMQTDSKTNIKEQSKELWIFQYDNEPDINQKELENLIELESGEFNFETLNTLFIQDPNYEFIEYHLFIKAIYNLLERNFYKHGIFRLGDHFIFTELPQENSIFMLSRENDTRG